MKKLIMLILFFSLALYSTAFALGAKAKVEKLSENIVKINVSSESNIKVTGYTINKGNNIVVYYIYDANGSNNDFITVDLNTVVRPYKIILADGNKGPFIQPFTDIANHPMKDYIRHLFDLGFIEGYEVDNTFRPDNNITRGEMITLIVRMFNLKENPENRRYFDDLDQNHWAYKYALKAIDNKLIEGYFENNRRLIKLDNYITVAEASKLIHDVFNIKNDSVTNYDVRFVSHWAKKYIQGLLNEEIISPKDDFYQKGDINRPITRGEVAMLISRALGK